MAGVFNKTSRQYNLKCIDKKGRRITCRVAPGMNDMDDDHWTPMSKDPYVLKLKEEGSIDFGKDVDDMLFDKEPDTKAKSKAVTPPKPKEEKKD